LASSCPEGALRVKPGLNSLKNALIKAKENGLKEIFLEDGVHDEQGGNVVIDFPITIIGESKDGCTIIGGLKIEGKKEDDVNVKHLTISQSKEYGVWGCYGMSFHLFHLNIEKSEWSGVRVYETKRNTMSNCQVSHSKQSGVVVWDGLLTMNGSGTSIHNNVTSGSSHSYGLYTCSSSSSIHLVSPLTKESVSINNGGGGNYKDNGTIKTIRPKDGKQQTAGGQQYQMVKVQCPLDAKPGMTLRLDFNGRTYEIVVPSGIAPGEEFEFPAAI
jgi:hypothetical protein